MTDEKDSRVEAEAADAVEPSVAPETTEPAAAERDVHAELAAAQEELARAAKALAEADLRAQAEIQNMRRRIESEAEKARKFAIERFARDVLAVADSLERGLNAVSAEDAALKPAREG